VIDVGVNRVDDADSPRGYRLVGDVAYDDVAAVAGAISPVPGGVGPMTITMLLANTLEAARRQHALRAAASRRPLRAASAARG
jgi:5,10-methylene-tetrahydrofolate dehydrogenase/methenyl tetrahydrofolate cyclohydrolase